GLRRLRRSHFPEQLFAGFVETAHGIRRVVGQKVRLDHVFHPPDIVGIDLGRDAPSFNDPGLNVVFFNACRTVSVLTALTKPSTTSSSASSCKVQRQRPWGGSLHASWTNFCSRSPLILIWSGRGGWALRSMAAWRLCVTRWWRTRATVRRLVPN